MKIRSARRLFDIFTKVVIAATFLFLALTFLDLMADIGFGSSEDDLLTAGGLAAFAVFFNLLGNALYRLIERYGPQARADEMD